MSYMHIRDEIRDKLNEIILYLNREELRKLQDFICGFNIEQNSLNKLTETGKIFNMFFGRKVIESLNIDYKEIEDGFRISAEDYTDLRIIISKLNEFDQKIVYFILFTGETVEDVAYFFRITKTRIYSKINKSLRAISYHWSRRAHTPIKVNF